ncbi:hypothetical protein WA026_011300 [Henosepilachna vigintioctopunctata]|uniref:Uncharacterized protein n=1 Tax=Henosepilachna vigintioctopunctata TaxID=420089 RepID=A0AAW1U7G8_9CUCU
MKSLSCFCDNDCCMHFNIGKIIYEDKSKLNIEDVYTDSETEIEAGPSSAVVQVVKSGDFIIDKSKLNVEDVYTDSESENEAGPSSTIVQALKTGDYIVVKLLGKTNMEYRYVSVIDKIDEEDGEIRVTCLKLCDNKGQLFRYNDDDMADITMDQVVQKLSNPNTVLKGNKMFYKFNSPVDVFERK